MIPPEFDVIAGILKLTLDNKLQWAQLPLESSSVASHALSNIDIAFEATYENAKLELLSGSELLSSSSSSSQYAQNLFPPTRVKKLVFEVVQPDGSRFLFPELTIVNDLFNVVHHKTAGVDSLFKSIVKASSLN